MSDCYHDSNWYLWAMFAAGFIAAFVFSTIAGVIYAYHVFGNNDDE